MFMARIIFIYMVSGFMIRRLAGIEGIFGMFGSLPLVPCDVITK